MACCTVSPLEPRSKSDSLPSFSLLDDALHSLMKEQLVRAIGKTLSKPGSIHGSLAAEEYCPLDTQRHNSAPVDASAQCSLADSVKERIASGAYTHDPTKSASSAPPMQQQESAEEETAVDTRRRRMSYSGNAPPPAEFFCPISHCLMTEPVTLLNTGITFNRTSIQAWMRTGARTCPVLGQPLQGWIALESNEKLRLRIVEWVQEQGINFSLLDNAAVLMHQLYVQMGQ
ncbi:hypothetical protein COCSUDRAFT_55295 [Coccomyxa subellipsoidea C-169]|uniref:U-box domain-containing protein n=1 Tax=Coccomyxa subellipsoidea (strain C-169) TaxID=574566 RepID=I0Z9F6_COCSC|nr:hypothetical protein COCSUDRAFT_55295 [Coccomyxa subellipsoidea C-169]EIE27275.1 hypothetical protein COCSUDRAFT_55295 [Coccomyxa subellipsoidea C-169]|eukprot:XP_005651819.1 hypothetical protein COCSUDRAFT_55295 [Coccomyxa subellipsoidea C-169]